MKLMTSLLKQEGLMVLESEELPVPVEETPADQIDTDTVADEIVSDIDASAGDVQEVEQTEEAVVELESLVQSLESALANGGITAREGKYAQMAGNLLVKQLGLESATVLSTEHFGGIGSRYDSTKIVMESFGEKVQAGYEKVVEWIKKMIAGMKALWVKVKQFVRGIAAKCESLKARIEALDSNESLVSGFTDPSLQLIGQYLLKDGATDFSHLRTVQSAVHAVSDAVYNKYVAAVTEAFGKWDGQTEFHHDGKFINVARIGDLPGNVEVTETADGSGVYKFKVTGAKIGNVTGKMLTKPELLSLVAAVETGCGYMQAHEKDWSALENALAAFESKAKQFNQNDRRYKLSSMMSQVTGVKSFIADFTKYMVQIMKNVLKYVELVLNNWGGKKVAEPAQP